MASFLNKLNRMRNVRMHATNEYHMPHPGLYHEIVQGVPWYGGVSRERPRRLDTGIDRVLSYVMKMRPEYKNFPWCAADNQGVYTHPATFASERICYLLDMSATVTIPEAFEIVDKEMAEKKAEVDLQVTLAREHAAKLGVVNQGVESLVIRANRVYDSVFKMREEAAVRERRNSMADMCIHVQREGDRLDMQDIIEFLPFRDEQLQFFIDFPEYRNLFPPLWWLANEVADAQSEATRQKEEGGDNTEGDIMKAESTEAESLEGEEQNEDGEGKLNLKGLFEDVSFIEDDPEGDALATWPPQAIFDRQKRNRVKLEEMRLSGVDPQDAELERALAEARVFMARNPPEQPMSEQQKQAHIGQLAAETIENKRRQELDDFGLLVAHKEATDQRTDRQGVLEKEKPNFFEKYRQFLVDNHDKPAKDRPNFVSEKVLYFGEKPVETPAEGEGQALSEAQELVIKYVEEQRGTLDRDSMRMLREQLRARLGDHAANEVFEYMESSGGAISAAQLEGLSYYDPTEPRRVNLTSNIELSPFYPENAFPPRGLLADPNVNMKELSEANMEDVHLPESYKKQYLELKEYGNKYAHAIEDYAPIKSPDYLVESIQRGLSLVIENTPAKQHMDVTTRAANLSQVIDNHKSSDFKSLEDYESKASRGDGFESESEITPSEESKGPTITSDAELQKMKKVALDELAKIAFESEAERKEYEEMLERRFEYLAAKRKERNQEWAQYWPSDKPETLIYRGPEVIREVFPEAYKLAVTRKYEQLTGLPLREALEIKSYVGLWKSVRAREQQATGTPRNRKKKEVKDLDLSEWQHSVSLDPSVYKK